MILLFVELLWFDWRSTNNFARRFPVLSLFSLMILCFYCSVGVINSFSLSRSRYFFEARVCRRNRTEVIMNANEYSHSTTIAEKYSVARLIDEVIINRNVRSINLAADSSYSEILATRSCCHNLPMILLIVFMIL